MKKKCLVLSLLLTLILSGCGKKEMVTVNMISPDDGISQVINNRTIGVSALIRLGNGLWYDSTTGVVYWWNGMNTTPAVTTPTPYYSSNGFLYRYIPETNTLEEIVGAKYEPIKEIFEYEN